MSETTATALLVVGCVLLVAGISGVSTTEQTLLPWSGAGLGIALVVFITGARAYQRFIQ